VNRWDRLHQRRVTATVITCDTSGQVAAPPTANASRSRRTDAQPVPPLADAAQPDRATSRPITRGSARPEQVELPSDRCGHHGQPPGVFPGVHALARQYATLGLSPSAPRPDGGASRLGMARPRAEQPTAIRVGAVGVVDTCRTRDSRTVRSKVSELRIVHGASTAHVAAAVTALALAMSDADARFRRGRPADRSTASSLHERGDADHR
jgi:hypothetical protein